jgi:hypothetical protein
MECDSYTRLGYVPHPAPGGTDFPPAGTGYPPAGTSHLLAGPAGCPAAGGAVTRPAVGALAAGQSGIPGVVAVPAHPGAPGSGRLFLEARESPDVGKVLPVFSTVGRLVAALGLAQPWAVLPLERAREVAACAGVERIVLDPIVRPSAWRWAVRDLEDFDQARRGQ